MSSGHTVPKSMRRIQEEYQGVPLKYVMVLIVVAITCLMLIIAVFSARNKIPALLMLFGVIVFFTKFMRSPKILTRSWLRYQYLIRGLKGYNIVAKYATSATFMKNIVPIVDFHEAGVIEFTGNRYGMLLKADPDRVSSDELEHHINCVRILADSLHGELMLKSYVESSDTVRHTERYLMSQLNETGRTKPEQDHIYSLYLEAVENTTPIIAWKFYIFLGFGRHDTLDGAYIAKKQYYPGIIDRFTNAGMHIIPVQNKDELGRIYRHLISRVQI